MNKITICFKKYFTFLIFSFAFIQISAQTTIYSENFSNGANGWTWVSTGARSGEWRFGTESTASSGATGKYAYTRRYNGQRYKNKTYVTTTKAISTFGYNNLTLDISVWYKTESNYDGMNIEYSLDGGTNWNILGTVGSGTNWYNSTEFSTSNGFPTNTPEWSGDSNGWINASINLSTTDSGFDNNANVQFRVNFASDNSTRDTGVAFDTFTVKGVAIVTGPEINIKGLGNSIVDGDTTPSTADDTDFGNVKTTSNVTHTFVIENLGNTNLNLTGASPYVSISGANAADFSVIAIPSTPIAGGANTTFQIKFIPGALGLRTATISISNDDSNENPYTFAIQGTGDNTVNYCASSGNLNYNTQVTLVNFNTINNATGPNKTVGYNDFTNISTDVIQGSSHNLTVNLNTDGNYTVKAKAWIDWNQDGDFLDSGEEYDLGSATNVADGATTLSPLSITIPNTATLGNTRMRVSAKYNAYPTPCETGFDGEVEDYTINVLSSTPAPDINVLGNTLTIVNGDTTPSTADGTNFGDIGVGSNTTHTFTIKNIGTANLNIGSNVTLTTGTVFTVTTQPTTTLLTPGESTSFIIQFAPTAIASYSDTVTITSDDTNKNPFTFSISGNGVSLLPVGPGGVTNNLKLWLRADKGLAYTDGQGVALWSDQGAGADATVHKAGQEPTYRDNATRNVNFNPVLDFSNTPGAPSSTDYNLLPQQYLEAASGFYTQDIFVVATPNNTVTNSTGAMDTFTSDSDPNNATDEDVTGIGYGSYSARFTNEFLSYAISTQAGYGIAETGSGSISGVGIINARNNNTVTKQELYYNANNVGNTEANASLFQNLSNTRYWIGRSQVFTASFDGRMSEIINFSSRLSDTDRNKVQSYLAIKYGITLGVDGTSMNYVDSNNNIIWDATANAGYNYDIAGIGRDDASLLNQKQSKSTESSGDPVLTIGLGTIATTNNANTNAFGDDGDFLVWGNNGQPLTLSGTDIQVNIGALVTTFTSIVNRKWKIVETTTVDIPDTKIAIATNDLSALPPLTGNDSYVIVIADDPNFTTGLQMAFMKTEGANQITTFDFSNTQYFTIGIAHANEAKRHMAFDGQDDYFQGKKVAGLTGNFTISSWVKVAGPNKAINQQTIVAKHNGVTGYRLYLDTGYKATMSWVSGGTQSITSNTALPLNKWHQVAVSFDGTNAKLYIDGVLDKTQAITSPPLDNNEVLCVGAEYDDKFNIIKHFYGKIDELRIWDIALSQDQIRYIMNQEIQSSGSNISGKMIPIGTTNDEFNPPKVGTAIPYSDLILYYNMNSYIGTDLNDLSINNNTATLIVPDFSVIETQTTPLPYETTANGDWDTAATWADNSVNDIPNTASLVNPAINIDWNIVETQNAITTNRDVKLSGLISNSNTLTVNSAHQLNISNYLKLNGKIDLQGESQLVQTTGSDLDVASGGTLECDQQGSSDSYTYNYWSSPVGNISTIANNTSHSIKDVLEDGTNPASPQAINFQSAFTAADGAATNPIILSTYWMYTFVNGTAGDINAWTQIGDLGSLQAGQGYTMKGSNASTSNQNYTFLGKPNNGDINLTLSANKNYLVGNPYPSAIDGIAFINDNLSVADGGNAAQSVIDGTLYFWDHFGGGTHYLKSYIGGYGLLTKLTSTPAIANDTRINNTGASSTKSPKQYIPVGQGFFVVANANLTGSGTIAFKNSQRIFKTETSGTSQFLIVDGSQKVATSTDTIPIIRLQFDSPDGWHRELALGFDAKTTDHYDIGYDGALIEDNAEDMYWLIDSSKYVIQGVKDFNTDRVLPLGIKISKAGIATIKLKSLENLPANTAVYIKDNLTGNTFKINATNNYTVNLQPGVYTNRFSLVFKPNTTLGIKDEILNKNIIIYYDKASKSVKINNNSVANITKITLYNYLGQSLKIWQKNLSRNTLSLSVPKTNGVFILKIDTNNGLISKKIIIN